MNCCFFHSQITKINFAFKKYLYFSHFSAHLRSFLENYSYWILWNTSLKSVWNFNTQHYHFWAVFLDEIFTKKKKIIFSKLTYVLLHLKSKHPIRTTHLIRFFGFPLDLISIKFKNNQFKNARFIFNLGANMKSYLKNYIRFCRNVDVLHLYTNIIYIHVYIVPNILLRPIIRFSN